MLSNVNFVLISFLDFNVELCIVDLKKVSFYSLGCRLNIAEMAEISKGFLDRGYQRVPFENPADVVFINTCTVTNKADATCRNIIRKAKKHSPNSILIVAGCYAQVSHEKIEGMKEVDLILGTSEKYKVFDYLDTQHPKELKKFVVNSDKFYGAATTLEDSHTRAFLKIQDGCNYMCSYCIIPYARGRVRSIEISEAVDKVKQLVDEGFKEIVLTGVNIGEYQKSSGERLESLIKKIIEVESLKRVRMSSIEPNTVTDELLSILKKSQKYQDHFHIPLQSGDSEILKAMRRRYTLEEYRKVIDKILQYFPNSSIGADIIVGYPGETDEHFQNTYNFLKSLPITHYHIFPYSKRDGTLAAKQNGHIDNLTKKERVTQLTKLGNKKLHEKMFNMVNTIQDVLFEKRTQDNSANEGFTSNYMKVRLDSPIDYSNQIIKVSITGTNKDKLVSVCPQ